MSDIREEAAAAAKRIQPTGDRVLVKLSRDLKKVGLIYLPDGGKSLDIVCSEVIARGPEVKARMWELAPGDWVLHVRVVGVNYDGVLGTLAQGRDNRKDADYKFLRESELLAVVDPSMVGKLDGQASYDEGATGMRDTRDL